MIGQIEGGPRQEVEMLLEGYSVTMARSDGNWTKTVAVEVPRAFQMYFEGRTRRTYLLLKVEPEELVLS